jgi:hypothetical protein
MNIIYTDKTRVNGIRSTMYNNSLDLKEVYIGGGLARGTGHLYYDEYLTFDILTSGTVGLISPDPQSYSFTIYYKINEGSWTSLTINHNNFNNCVFNVSQGDKVKFKATQNSWYLNSKSYHFYSTATFDVSGNIMSLLYGDDFIGKRSFPSEYYNTFWSLFVSSKPVNAKDMILPADTLLNNCYRYMFNYCTTLVSAPELPAMTLAEGCYQQMFYGCTSLGIAPELPAAHLNAHSYQEMFRGCSKLNYIKCLATYTSASDCLRNWTVGVSNSGTFIKDANTTWPTGVSGIPSGWTVQNA